MARLNSIKQEKQTWKERRRNFWIFKMFLRSLQNYFFQDLTKLFCDKTWQICYLTFLNYVTGTLKLLWKSFLKNDERRVIHLFKLKSRKKYFEILNLTIKCGFWFWLKKLCNVTTTVKPVNNNNLISQPILVNMLPPDNNHLSNATSGHKNLVPNYVKTFKSLNNYHSEQFLKILLYWSVEIVITNWTQRLHINYNLI